MRYAILLVWMLLGSMTAALAQVSVGIGLPGVSIGINLPMYPRLVRVPDYPVYYAPGLDSNFFFYDGMYWVYQSDNWYTSDWYNGPWGFVGPEYVPVFVLRIPVRYYRNPPVYFGGWRGDTPPRWGEHWGNDWERRRGGWDRWDRAFAPAIAPLPVYQRQYSGDRYPRAEQQQVLRSQNYRYQPREAVARQQFQEHAAPRAFVPAPPRPNGSSQERSPREPEARRPGPPSAAQRQPEPAEPRARAPQRGDDEAQRPVPPPPRQRERQQPAAPAAQDQDRQPQPSAAERAPQAPRSNPRSAPQGTEPAHEPGRGRGQDEGKDKDRGKGEDRGQPGRN